MSASWIGPSARYLIGAFALAFSLAPVAGCFRSPDISKLKCTGNPSCPGGYFCAIPFGQSQGSCVKGVVELDGSSIETSVPSDGAAAIDVNLTTDDSSVPDIGQANGPDQVVATKPDATSPDAPLPIPDAFRDAPLDVPSSSVDLGCLPGSLKCNNLQPQTCDQTGIWQTSGAPCAIACLGGVCTGACSPGTKQCKGLQPQTCEATGTWQNNGIVCSYVCDNFSGSCTGSCTPGLKQCNVSQPQICDASGTWQNNGTVCTTTACNGGACTGSCLPNSTNCNGPQPEVCDSMGIWRSNGAPCPHICSAGACTGICAPGAKQCNLLQPQTCDSTGTWQNAGTTACAYVCSNGACAGSCSPGAKQCNLLQPQSCDSTGTWQNAGTSCPYVCSNGTCAGFCTPGGRQCNLLQPQTCDSTGTWQNAGTSCPYACSAGACAGSCAPGSRQCGPGDQPQTCDSTGTWQNAGSACTGSCETCTSGQCSLVNGIPPAGKSCNGTGACAGACNGQSSSCTYPDASTTCGTANCSNGAVTNTACNGAGGCSVPVTQSCNGFPCTGSQCAVYCTDRSTTGCSSGYKCVGGTSCVASSVTCGTGSCPVDNGQQCCAADVNPGMGGDNAHAVYTCLSLGQSCSASGIQCTSKSECPSGQICCDSGYSYGYPAMWAIGCTTPSNCTSSGPSFAFQVCDPNLYPTECLTGTCQSSPTGIPGLYVCQ